MTKYKVVFSIVLLCLLVFFKWIVPTILWVFMIAAGLILISIVFLNSEGDDKNGQD